MRYRALLAFAIVLGRMFDGADASDFVSLYGKHIAGYQGWFGCPADGVGWFHWFRSNKASPDHLLFDMLPDVSWLGSSEGCDTGLVSKSGHPVYLFSSRDPDVVREHFRWMRQYGLDGVALQRFVSTLSGSQGAFTDAVLQNVRQAAEAEGRGFFIMYDLSGTEPLVVQKISQDWAKLTDMGIQRSPSYMYHRGKPLVGLWGAGFTDRGITVAQITQLIRFFHDPRHPATIVGGVPMHWRTLGQDSKKDPRWSDVYRSFDVISPWSVGRVENAQQLVAFLAGDLRADIQEAARIGRDYLPVLYPGMSWFNGQHGHVSLNSIPRLCGAFYKSYGEGLIKAGIKMLYTAMFDEVNEGTAIFKVDVSRTQGPRGAVTASLSDGDCPATSDMYLRIAGSITRQLRNQGIHK